MNETVESNQIDIIAKAIPNIVFGNNVKITKNTIQSRIISTAMDPTVIESAGDIKDNPWLNTVFAPYVRAMTRSKGKYGEAFARKILTDHGLHVESIEKPNNNSQSKSKKTKPKSDLVIDNMHVEIKFSLAQFNKKKNMVIDNKWMLNHVSGSKIWERLIFIGINFDTNKSIIGWMNKQDFYTALGTVDNKNNSVYFSHQQAGKKGNNDDYLSAGKKLQRLLNSGFLRDISTW